MTAAVLYETELVTCRRTWAKCKCGGLFEFHHHHHIDNGYLHRCADCGGEAWLPRESPDVEVPGS